MLESSSSISDDLDIVFEDEQLLIVNKPPGLLSQPGKTVFDSVSERVRNARPEASGSLLVHRLDMDTSGLLMLGKNRHAHRELQRQFENRTIGKRYHAVLERPVNGRGGCIDLPLRADIENRPRQIVCTEHGKRSISYWSDVSNSERGSCVVLYPRSGRSHQLRVHLADRAGLDNPIRGDRLYGRADERLMLHASGIAFDHPETSQRLIIQIPVPFPGFDHTLHSITAYAYAREPS